LKKLIFWVFCENRWWLEQKRFYVCPKLREELCRALSPYDQKNLSEEIQHPNTLAWGNLSEHTQL